MDLVPTPDQVVAAVGNVVRQVRWGGLADLRPTPRTLVGEGELREVQHFRAVNGVDTRGDPVLLVAPLVAPATCYDLRRGCSLAEHLVAGGRPTYLVDYGRVSFADRHLDLDHWVETVLPEAVREVSRHAGGRPVHLVGWSLGGTLSLVAAATSRRLPIASTTVLGTPFDLTQVPLVAPPRPLLEVELPAAWRPVTRVVGAFGAGAAPVRWAVDVLRGQQAVIKPLALLAHLDDREFLAQVEAVSRFQAGLKAYRGRTFGQAYHRFVSGAGIADGVLSAVACPVLVVAGATDGIAPIGSVRAVEPLLTGSLEVRLEIVPGGHLGLLTGREARRTTWVALDEWLDQWSGRSAPSTRPVRRRATAKAASSRTAGRRAGGPSQVSRADAAQIGSNPRRRYDSKPSRGLAPRKAR